MNIWTLAEKWKLWKNQVETFEFIILKNTISEIKNSTERLISRLDRANKIITETENVLNFLENVCKIGILSF